MKTVYRIAAQPRRRAQNGTMRVGDDHAIPPMGMTPRRVDDPASPLRVAPRS